jgi:serine protease Do
MIVRTLALAALTIVTLLPASALASADTDAVARSVVRVVVISANEDGEAGVGMGSGVAIAPNRILTNAHVVKQARESDGFVGIVPSEGRKRFEGRIVAYREDLDLAVVDIGTGRLPPATLYSGVMPDGAGVTALGYPYAVDRAIASGIDAMIVPQSPLKTLGHVVGRRSNANYDTVVHDASIGRGNSGGPLVDSCGRVVGINSFLSVSEGIDSTFAFAISEREVAAFLKANGVAASAVTTPCLSDGEASARAAALAKADDAQAALEAGRTAAGEAKAAKEKASIRDDIAAERENGFALAGVLFVVGALALGSGLVLMSSGKRATRRRNSTIAFALGGLLAIGAVVVFFGRPKLADVEDRYAKAHPAKPAPVIGDTTATEGAKICVLVADRSIVKISKTDDVPLDWKEGGCVNGKTQYGNNAGVWSRAFVPNAEPTITVQSYDPAKARYTVDRYLMSADAMEKARAVRARYTNKTCVTDPGQRQSVADMESAIRATLPPAPNERLVFDCRAKSGG